jgi:hypothetical protein
MRKPQKDQRIQKTLCEINEAKEKDESPGSPDLANNDKQLTPEKETEHTV